MDASDLMVRLKRLEDIEALRQLKYRYCRAADDNYDGELVASLVTEDGIWDGGTFGRFQGCAEIAARFNDSKDVFAYVSHQVGNPDIVVDGDRAICDWYLLLTKISKAGDRSMLFAGTYRDICVRTAESWRFKELHLKLQPLPPLQG